MSSEFDPMGVQTAKGNPEMKPQARKPAEAKMGHNGTGLDETQEKVFIRELKNINESNSEMASLKGVQGGIYKRLEQAGFTKDHIKWAQTLEKQNVSEVLRDLRMKIAIAKLLGHAAGRQMDLIDDRTPLEDQAYLEGLSAGKLGRDPANPYGMETTAGQRWIQGMNEGAVIRNAALNEAVNGGQRQAEVIRGPGADNDDGADDDADENGGSSEDEGGLGAETDGETGSDTDVGTDADAADGSGTALSGEIIPPGSSDDDDWDAADPSKVTPPAAERPKPGRKPKAK